MFKVKSERKMDGTLTKVIDKDSIDELYYMCDIANLISILEHGILSHRRVDRKIMGHTDISNDGVQENRSRKRIERPEASKKPMSLHRHTPLYLNPHNGMMHSLTRNNNDKDKHKSLCVLRVDKAILNRRNVIFSDKNAACSSTSFFTPDAFKLESPASEYLSLPYGYVPDEDPLVREERKQTRQAEALIPYEVQRAYIRGILVSNSASKAAVEAELMQAGLQYEVDVVSSMFFHGNHGWPPRLNLSTVTRLPSLEECPASPESSSSEEESDEMYLSLKRHCPQIPLASISSPTRLSEIDCTLLFAKQLPCPETSTMPSKSSPTRLNKVDIDSLSKEVASTSSPESENDNEMAGVGKTC